MVCVGFLSSLLTEAEVAQPCCLHTGSLNDCTRVLLAGKRDSPGTTAPLEEVMSRDFGAKLLEVFARHPWGCWGASWQDQNSLGTSWYEGGGEQRVRGGCEACT